MDKINVDLYGGKGLFGGREKPLEADIIYCDKYKECTFYKDDKCLRCRSFLSPTCKYGSNSVKRGYTSRAKKYYVFKTEWQNDPVYNKLRYPSEAVAVIANNLYLHLNYVKVYRKNENDSYDYSGTEADGYIIRGSTFGCGVFIPLSEVTNSLLFSICTYRPRAMTGVTIKEYHEKVVPDIIYGLKTVVPEIYMNFISEHPEYDMEPNYVGKYAYIKTMVEGSKLQDCHGNCYILRDGKLYCEHMTKGFVPFDGESAKVEVTVKDKSTYKITSNEQCDENTRFA